MKLKSIPDKPLPYFGLCSRITSTPLFTHHLDCRPGLMINKPGDSFIHTSGNSAAEAKPRNMLWLSRYQKKPGCSRLALLSAALNAARMKHHQTAQGRIKEPLHFAWDIDFTCLTGIQGFTARQGTCVPARFFVTVCIGRSNTESPHASQQTELLQIQSKGKEKAGKSLKQIHPQ